MILILVLSAVSLSACSVIPSLSTTEEQDELIAEYSAGLLLKYNRGHALGLTPIWEEDFEDEAAALQEDLGQTEEIAEIADAPEIISTEPEGEPLNEMGDTLETVVSNVPMAEAFNLAGLDVSYNGYECMNVYPEDGGTEMTFSMQASAGKILMVTHFNITNTGSEPVRCAAAESDVKARIVIDGGRRIPALTTILLNDLLTYDGEIAGGEAIDAVIVFEVDENAAASMQNISLIVIGSAGEQAYNLNM